MKLSDWITTENKILGSAIALNYENADNMLLKICKLLKTLLERQVLLGSSHEATC